MLIFLQLNLFNDCTFRKSPKLYLYDIWYLGSLIFKIWQAHAISTFPYLLHSLILKYSSFLILMDYSELVCMWV